MRSQLLHTSPFVTSTHHPFVHFGQFPAIVVLSSRASQTTSTLVVLLSEERIPCHSVTPNRSIQCSPFRASSITRLCTPLPHDVPLLLSNAVLQARQFVLPTNVEQYVTPTLTQILLDSERHATIPVYCPSRPDHGSVPQNCAGAWRDCLLHQPVAREDLREAVGCSELMHVRCPEEQHYQVILFEVVSTLLREDHMATITSNLVCLPQPFD